MEQPAAGMVILHRLDQLAVLRKSRKKVTLLCFSQKEDQEQLFKSSRSQKSISLVFNMQVCCLVQGEGAPGLGNWTASCWLAVNILALALKLPCFKIII